MDSYDFESADLEITSLFLEPSLSTHDEGGSIPASTRVPSWVLSVIDNFVQTPGNPWGSRSTFIRTMLIAGIKVLAKSNIKPGDIIDEILFREEQASRRVKESRVLTRAKASILDLEESVIEYSGIGSNHKAKKSLLNFLTDISKLSSETKEDYLIILRANKVLMGYISKDSELLKVFNELL